MSYNSQISTFIVGDLVYFTGYELDSSPEAHKLGIVIGTSHGIKPHKLYQVLWLYNGTKVNVSGKHLELAYIRKV